MNLRVLTLLLFAIFLLVLTFSISFAQITQGDYFLIRAGVIIGGSGLLIGMFWLGYTAYAMHCLVPKADVIVDPELSEQLQRRGDYSLYRVHRLSLYGFSSASRLGNRRLHPEFDFRQLPCSLRAPLAVHFHGMWLFLFLGFCGAAFFELAEFWGQM